MKSFRFASVSEPAFEKVGFIARLLTPVHSFVDKWGTQRTDYGSIARGSGNGNDVVRNIDFGGIFSISIDDQLLAIWMYWRFFGCQEPCTEIDTTAPSISAAVRPRLSVIPPAARTATGSTASTI